MQAYCEKYGQLLPKQKREVALKWISKFSGVILGIGMGIRYTPMIENQEQIHNDAEIMSIELLKTLSFTKIDAFTDNKAWYEYGKRPGSQFIVSIFAALLGEKSLDVCTTKLEKSLVGEQYKEILQAFIVCALIRHNFKNVPFEDINWNGIFTGHIPLLINAYSKHCKNELKSEKEDALKYAEMSYKDLIALDNNSILRNVFVLIKAHIAKESINSICNVATMNGKDRSISLYNNMVVFALYGSIVGHEEILKLAKQAKLDLSLFEEKAIEFLESI